MKMDPISSALGFVESINSGDLEGLAALMTEDHKFTDSLGNECFGRTTVRQAWERYLSMVPDYRIEVRQTLVDGDVVVLLGTASGTYGRGGLVRGEDAWSTPAAWRARIIDGCIAEWQVYADNEPIRQRISAHSA